jgi:hypothetical protein
MTTATEASAATGGDAHPGGDDLGDIFELMAEHWAAR